MTSGYPLSPMMMSKDALGSGSCPNRIDIYAVSMISSQNIAVIIPNQGNMQWRQVVRDSIDGLIEWMVGYLIGDSAIEGAANRVQYPIRWTVNANFTVEDFKKGIPCLPIDPQ